MKIVFIGCCFLCLTSLLIACRQGDPLPSAPIKVDTTITPSVAVTQLALDSTSVRHFISQQKIADSTALDLQNFYNSRNFQYAWFNEEGLTPNAEGFWSMHEKRINLLNDSSLFNRQLHNSMHALLNEDTALSGEALRQTELGLTLHFFYYVKAAFNGSVSPDEMQWYIPRRKLNTNQMLDSFLVIDATAWQPLNASFHRLNKKLYAYAQVARNGGWPRLPVPKRRLKSGSRDSLVYYLKKRLAITNGYNLADTTLSFNAELSSAIKKAQRSFGQKESGEIDESLVSELNVTVEERMRQMKINLERMRWMPAEEPRRLVANIPDFTLHVFDSGKEVLNMNVVVGTAAHRTVIFSDWLQYIVFSPYWNVPRSIVQAEIYPAMQRSGSYLRRNNMEVTKWSNGLPVVRQKPGPDNALGQVKFIFPNRYNIYFHDTPARSLFGRQNRAFSHGCIRLQHPFALAKYLLHHDSTWTDKAIKNAMNQHSETQIKMNEEWPVFIVYFTAWVDEEGELNFRKDIYGHDSNMEKHLFG